MPPGPTLNITSSTTAGAPVQVSVDSDGEWVEMSVRDGGPTPRLPRLPAEPPPVLHTGGRGLWLILQLVDEVVEALEGVLPDLADRLGAVGLPGGVTEVEHRLVRKLVQDLARDGQAAEPGVEDPDRRVGHAPPISPTASCRAGACARRSTPAARRSGPS